MSYNPNITTQQGLREEFWDRHPEFKRRGRTKQNDYCAEIRLAWCNFVEYSQRNGDISEQLAQRATL